MVCRGCGVTTRRGQHCPKCGREVSRGKLIELAKKHSETQRRHEAAKRAWRSSTKPAWPDENTYVRQIQPRLVGITISVLGFDARCLGALCRLHPHRPTPPAPEALAGAGGTRWCYRRNDESERSDDTRTTESTCQCRPHMMFVFTAVVRSILCGSERGGFCSGSKSRWSDTVRRSRRRRACMKQRTGCAVRLQLRRKSG
jgi:hypothetical protein